MRVSVFTEPHRGATYDDQLRMARHAEDAGFGAFLRADHYQDRKSTRLNSSHANISYAVFCLKKKKISEPDLHTNQISQPVYGVPLCSFSLRSCCPLHNSLLPFPFCCFPSQTISLSHPFTRTP